MTLLPAPSLSLRRAPGVLNQKDKDRERALIFIFAFLALAAGVLAAVASYAALAFAAVLLLIALVAWTLPLTWLGAVLAALVPFQFYLPVPGTSFTLRAALVFLVAIAVRLAAGRSLLAVGRRWSSVVWLLPPALFLLAALLAALGAQDRYAAFKGIYDWLVVFLTAIVIAALAPSAGTVRRILAILITGGVAQALLGLLQYALGLDTIFSLLRLPVSGWLYQPNLLQDRLDDLSFNWVNFDRALPFGTFINGIDYAVFLAAILSATIALVIVREQSSRPVCHCEEHPERSRHPERNGAQRSGVEGAGGVEGRRPRAPQRGRDEPIPNAAHVALQDQNFTPRVQVRDNTVSSHPGHEPPSAVGRPRSLVALAIAAIPVAVALLLTFKGSGLLALLGGMAAIALASLPRISKRTVVIGLVVAVGALIVALPFADLIGQRALFLMQREQGSLGTAGRLQIWASLVESVAQRPLFGFGLNNATALIAPQWTLRDGALGFVFSTPESAYVSALVETGMVGFVALVGWLSMAAANGYRRARAAKEPALYIAMVAALVALVFGNITVSGLTTDQNGMLLGMLIGLIYGSRQDD